MPTRLTITALISAPVQKVWDCWTMPEHIVNWNFAAEDWQCPWAKNDLRVGGKYAARMEAKDGSFGFDFEAVYNTVDLLKEITYTMGDGRMAKTIFESHGDMTNVTTTFDAESQNPPEMQQQGWQMILNNFKKYVERI